MMRVLSLGAGVQSTTVLLLSCAGEIPKFDAAIFADTGWEPKAVTDHLDRLEAHAAEHGIPVYRVSSGNIRDDALDPEHSFASMPLYVISPCQICAGADGKPAGEVFELSGEVNGKTYTNYTGVCPRCKGTGKQPGMGRRQCTNEYKLKPIKVKTRELLGYPYPATVPKDVYVEMAIGISVDEIERAKDSGVQYLRNVHPLLDLGWTRADCKRYNRSQGWLTVVKSACIGCPFHGNEQWRKLRDESPEEFADAVEFDAAIRADSAGNDLRASMFVHRSRLPLGEAPINRVTSREWRARQVDVFDAIADAQLEGFDLDEDGDPDGCSPWACRSGEPVTP